MDKDVIYIYIYIHIHTYNIPLYIYVYTKRNIKKVYKKNEIMPFATTYIDLEIITLSEVRKRKTNIWYYLYMESKIGHK